MSQLEEISRRSSFVFCPVHNTTYTFRLRICIYQVQAKRWRILARTLLLCLWNSPADGQSCLEFTVSSSRMMASPNTGGSSTCGWESARRLSNLNRGFNLRALNEGNTSRGAFTSVSQSLNAYPWPDVNYSTKCSLCDSLELPTMAK